MKRYLAIAAMVFLFFLLQTTVFASLPVISCTPNLLLLLAVSIGFMQGKKEGMLTGFFCGLLIDVFYGSMLGFYALIYLYLGYGSGFFHEVYFEEDIRVPLLLVSAADFLYGLVCYFTLFFLRGRIDFFGYLGGVIFPELVFTVLMTLLLYRPIYRINKKLRGREGDRGIWLRS